MLHNQPSVGIPAGEVPINSSLSKHIISCLFSCIYYTVGQPQPHLASVGMPTGLPYMPPHGYAHLLVPMFPQQGVVTQPQPAVSAAPSPHFGGIKSNNITRPL